MLRIRTILHPTDFSPPAENAWHVACSLARLFGAKLILLHVHRPVAAPLGEFGKLPSEPKSTRGAIEQDLAAIEPTDRSLHVTRVALEGAPGPEIIRFAKDGNCDLIVMGTHGRTGLVRLLLGSVAEEVVRKAPCAVLTLKNPVAELDTCFTSEVVELAAR